MRPIDPHFRSSVDRTLFRMAWKGFVFYGVLLVALIGGCAQYACGQQIRSANFYFQGGAASPQMAAEIVKAAETARRDLATQWFGGEFPTWREPCPIKVRNLTSGGGGCTGLAFDTSGGGYYGPIAMTVEGQPEKLLTSVVPHEVMHTLMAEYFQRPLPRWLDEGIATCVETEAEQNRYRTILVKEVLTCGRGIAFARMFRVGEGDLGKSPDYGSDPIAFYAQGFSATDFLLQIGGREELLAYVAEGLSRGHAQALDRYGFSSQSEFQNTWLEWVKAGSPRTERLVAYQGCYTLPNGYRVCPLPQQRPQAVPAQRPLVPVVPRQPAQQIVPRQQPTQQIVQPTAPQTPVASSSPAACTCKPVKGCECDPTQVKTLQAQVASQQQSINGLKQQLAALAGEVRPFHVVFEDGNGQPHAVQEVSPFGGELRLPAIPVQKFYRDKATGKNVLQDEERYPLGSPLKLRYGVPSEAR